MRAAAVASVLIFGCTFPGARPSDTGDQDSGATPDGPVTDADMCRADWFDCNYRARRAILVDNTGRAELEGFPVAIRFDGSDLRYGNFGDQLRFRGGTDSADLSFEVEEMGANALVWVRVDLPSNGVASVSMYYDNPANAVESSGMATFAGFAGVYHFSDTFAGTADPVNSSTEQNNLGVISNLSTGDQVNTPFGLGIDVGADVNEYFETSNATTDFIAGDNQALSFEAWFRTPDVTDDRVLIDNVNEDCRGIVFFVSDGSEGVDGGLVGALRAGNNCSDETEDTIAISPAVDDDTWRYGVFLIDRAAQTLEVLVDGVLQDSASGIRQTGRVSDRATRFGNSTLATDDSFAGVIGEIRIGPLRVLDWYEATFANSAPNSQMVTVLPEQLVDESQ